MKRSLIVFLMLCGFFLAVLAYGYSLPVEHQITMQRHYKKPVDEIWKIIVDYGSYSRWRENVYEINEIPAKGEYQAWKEVDAYGHSIAFEIIGLDREKQMIIRLEDATLPYDGKWTFDLIPDAAGTTLKITEHGMIDNILLRVIAHLVTGYTSKIDSWLNSLDNKFALEARMARSNTDNPATVIAPPEPSNDLPVSQ